MLKFSSLLHLRNLLLYLVLLFFQPVASQASTKPGSNSLFDLSLKELLNVNFQTNEPQKIFWSANSKPQKNSINIGLIVPLSDQRQGSVELMAAAETAIVEINRAGGINGKPLALLVADDNFDGPRQIKLTHELIDKYQVKAIIGPLSSEAVIRIAEVTVPAGVLMFPPAANANQIAEIEDKDLIFRLPATNQQITQKMAEFLTLNAQQKVSIFYQRDVFGEEIYTGLQHYLKQDKRDFLVAESLSMSVNFQTYSLSYEIRNAQKQMSQAIVLALSPKQLKAIIDQFNHKWSGSLPMFLLPEHADMVSVVSKLDKPVCIFSIVPNLENKRPDILRGIEKTLDIASSSYTGVFVYDSTHLIAASLLYQEMFGSSLSNAVRRLTDESGLEFGTNLAELKSKLKKAERFSFVGKSGPVNFNTEGDNNRIQLYIRPFHALYGIGCEQAYITDAN